METKIIRWYALKFSTSPANCILCSRNITQTTNVIDVDKISTISSLQNDNRKALKDAKTSLIFFRRVSFKGVCHEASIWSLGDKGMTGSHNLKAQKAEGAKQCSPVISVLVETNKNVVNLKLFFSKFKQHCKAIFTSFRESTSWYLDIEVVFIQNCSPVNKFGFRKFGLDVKDSCPIVWSKFLCYVQPIIWIK